MSFRFRLLVLAVAALLVPGSGVAGGDESGGGARQEAQRLRDDGVRAVDRGDFAGAVDCFRRAYALYPSANLHYNLGVALDQLGRSAEAVEAFEEFLAALPGAPAAQLAFARERVAALDGRVARLELEVTPADAVVAVDGTEVRLPRTRALPLPPGERVITVARHAGEAPALTHRVSLAASEHRRLSLTLESAVSVEPTPPPVVETRAPPVAPTPPAAPPRKRLRAPAIGLAALGGASLIVGATFAGLTASVNDQVNSVPAGGRFDPALVQRGALYQALEEGFLIAGGVVSAGAIVLFVLDARRRTR